jgi:hypothetical protein
MDVAGKESRSVYFYTDSGEVYLRRSSRKSNQPKLTNTPIIT